MFAPRAPLSVNAPLCKSVETTRMSCELGEGRSSLARMKVRETEKDTQTYGQTHIGRSAGV